MDFHMTAVERHLFRCVMIAGDRRQEVLPNTPLAPTRKTVVDCLVRSVLTRTILPPTARSLNMHDPAQNPPVVFSLGPGLVSWQMPLDLRPLRVAEPKQALVHRLAPVG